MRIEKDLKKKILLFQKYEITEYYIYRKLSARIRSKENSKILSRIADDELSHYNQLKDISGEEIKPNKFKIYWYYFLALIFGLTFSLKLLEIGEERSQSTYDTIIDKIPETKKIIIEEEEHEKQLLEMIEEEKLKYVGSIVLGLNDALVELTGTLAG